MLQILCGIRLALCCFFGFHSLFETLVFRVIKRFGIETLAVRIHDLNIGQHRVLCKYREALCGKSARIRQIVKSRIIRNLLQLRSDGAELIGNGIRRHIRNLGQLIFQRLL